MLGRIRGARVSFGTFVVVVVLALLVWAVVVYVEIRDFVPEGVGQADTAAVSHATSPPAPGPTYAGGA